MADLFGAATRGVDPQTGRYLTKEQRIAMFRASRGMGGGIGGSGTGARAAANPRTAIVAVNNLSGAIAKIQENNQNTAITIAEVAQQNKKNIENIYNVVNEQKKEELKQINDEVKDANAARESRLRQAREGLLEGISGAAAGVARAGQAVANAALKPVRALWERIAGALGYLLGAFVIRNLPKIVSSIENFIEDLPDLSGFFQDSFDRIRGVWSVLDNLVKSTLRIVNRIVRTAGRVGGFILRKASSIGRRIFEPIGRFIRRVVTSIINKVANFVGDLAKQASDAIGNALKNAGKGVVNVGKGIVKGTVGFALGLGKRAADQLSKTQAGRTVLDVGKKGFGAAKGLLQTGQRLASTVSSLPGQISKGVGGLKDLVKNAGQGVKKFSDAARQSWISKALSPVTNLLKRIGGKTIAGALGGIGRLIKGVPIIGSVIDILLNKNISGQSWTEAIIRGLASGTFGSLGWAGGAAAGAALGSVVPGFGTAIGGVIGGIAGAILAGYFGDQGGALLYEAVTGNKRTQATDTSILTDTERGKVEADKISNAIPDSIKSPAAKQAEENRSPRDYEFKTSGMVESMTRPSSSTTPQTLGLVTNQNQTGGNVTVINNKSVDTVPVDTQKDAAPRPAQKIPRIKSADPLSDRYRKMAAKYYYLTVPV
jgi:gas vesicle protein